MTTDVTEIINAISNALGIAYNKAIDLYPSVVKMNIVSNIFSFLAGTIFCILAYWLLWENYKRISKRKKEKPLNDFDHDDNFTYADYADVDICGVLVFIGAISAMFGVTACLISGCNLINWIVAPDIMSIKWVVNLMK